MPIHPVRLCHEINEFLQEDTVYIGDGGDIVTFSGSIVRPHKPGGWMDPGPLGTLGVGTGFAMASKLAQPQRDVVTLYGDCSFTLTGFDFITMVHRKLPYVGVIGNNSSWNQIRFGQERQVPGPRRHRQRRGRRALRPSGGSDGRFRHPRDQARGHPACARKGPRLGEARRWWTW